MKTAALLSLTAILAYACFERAGVEPKIWNPCVVGIGAIGAIYFLAPRGGRAPRLDRWVAICMGAVIAIAALQVVPLPVGLVRWISPARVELLRATAPALGGIPGHVTLSVAPYSTAQAVLSLAAYGVIFLLIRDVTLRMGRRPWAAVAPLIAVVGLEALLGFLQAFGASDAHATGTYNSYDHYAGLLEMALPLPIVYAVAILQRNRRPRGVPGAVAMTACALLAMGALLLIGIVFSLSRMAFFCGLAALAVVGVLALSVRGWRADGRRTAPLWRRALPAVLVGGAIAAGFVFLPTDPLIARFAGLASTSDITADTRFQLWRDTAPLVKDYPLFGCGFGGYESCFLRYKSVAPMNTADFAHNDYLQALAELGIFGFAAGMIFVLRILAGAGRQVLYAQSVDERYRAIGCVAAITAMLLHSIVDFNMYVPANAFVFAWIAAIASCSLTAQKEAREPDAEGKAAGAWAN